MALVTIGRSLRNSTDKIRERAGVQTGFARGPAEDSRSVDLHASRSSGTLCLSTSLGLVLLVACGETQTPEPMAADAASDLGLADLGFADVGPNLAELCPDALTASDAICAEGRCEWSTGDYAGELSFSSEFEHVLGRVHVGDGTQRCRGRLRIDPGTVVILNDPELRPGYLTIRPHSRIEAEGTADSPIRLTAFEGGRAGPLSIAGRAPASCNVGNASCAYSQVGIYDYGGDDPEDSSGVLRYLRFERGGTALVACCPPAPLSLAGVGRGTIVENIHVDRSQAEGIDILGGTVDLRKILVTGSENDGLSWIYGWRGRVQHLIIQQHEDRGGDNGLEGDANPNAYEFEPWSRPVFSNMTIVGASRSTRSDFGILVRSGSGAHIYNALVLDMNRAGFDIDEAPTFARAMSGEHLFLRSSIFWNNGTTFEEEDGDPFTLRSMVLGPRFGSRGNAVVDPGLPISRSDTVNWDFVPTSTAALQGAETPPDPWFEVTTYKGGLGPGEDWTAWARP